MCVQSRYSPDSIFIHLGHNCPEMPRFPERVAWIWRLNHVSAWCVIRLRDLWRNPQSVWDGLLGSRSTSATARCTLNTPGRNQRTSLHWPYRFPSQVLQQSYTFSEYRYLSCCYLAETLFSSVTIPALIYWLWVCIICEFLQGFSLPGQNDKEYEPLLHSNTVKQASRY